MQGAYFTKLEGASYNIFLQIEFHIGSFYLQNCTQNYNFQIPALEIMDVTYERVIMFEL